MQYGVFTWMRCAIARRKNRRKLKLTSGHKRRGKDVKMSLLARTSTTISQVNSHDMFASAKPAVLNGAESAHGQVATHSLSNVFQNIQTRPSISAT